MAYIVTPKVTYFSQRSNKECWYIAYKMLVAHRSGMAAVNSPPLKIQLMHERSAKNSGMGLPVEDFAEFAAAAGLVSTLSSTTEETTVLNTAPITNTIGRYSSLQLEALLRNHGPLWVSWKIHTGGHIVVVVGVDEKNVYYNDPQAGENRTISLHQFNRNLNPRSPDHQIMFLPTTATNTLPMTKTKLSSNELAHGVALP